MLLLNCFLNFHRWLSLKSMITYTKLIFTTIRYSSRDKIVHVTLQDGAPQRFSTLVPRYLDEASPDIWIEGTGLIPVIARYISDGFLFGTFKNYCLRNFSNWHTKSSTYNYSWVYCRDRYTWYCVLGWKTFFEVSQEVCLHEWETFWKFFII